MYVLSPNPRSGIHLLAVHNSSAGRGEITSNVVSTEYINWLQATQATSLINRTLI